MNIPEFILPDWLENCSSDVILQRMMDELPADIDKTEGGFPWDFTAPTALEVAELLQFHIPETLKIMYPMWAYGKWLDYHAQQVNIERKSATCATGVVHVTGTAGTIIPSGFRFAISTDGTTPAVEFATIDVQSISDEGYADIEVVAVIPGVSGNVAAGTISVMSEPMSGIKSISNLESTTGGTPEETDNSLRERIQEIYAMAETSFIGCDADFRRWALEVDGIGDCIVVAAANGPGTVKLVLVDANGQPANEKLVQDVYDHIVSPKDRSKRLLPTACAELICAPATTIEINYTITGLVFDSTTSIEQIKTDFKTAIKAVYVEAKQKKILRYNDVRPIISDIAGVIDFNEFFIDGKTSNIRLSSEEYPETGVLEFREAV